MPLFFSGEINNANLLLNAFLAFLAFSSAASAVYIFNDINDIKQDLAHPRKRFRPIASAEIGKKTALLVMMGFTIFSFTISSQIAFEAILVIIFYLMINVAYSFYLKHIVILDINVIACGFVLRILLGSLVTQTDLSMWIIVLTYLLALFLALAKRRDDVLIFLKSGKKMRKAIDGYSINFIDRALLIIATTIVITYISFTVSNDVQLRIKSEYLYLTVLFVLFGLLRYLQITFIDENTASPVSIILKDRFLQIMIFLWLSSFSYLLYF
tara:strand:+ start:844 stop:1650 length:807 start_codon:yes stop_codon:yes gene_type:complete